MHNVNVEINAVVYSVWHLMRVSLGIGKETSGTGTLKQEALLAHWKILLPFSIWGICVYRVLPCSTLYCTITEQNRLNLVQGQIVVVRERRNHELANDMFNSLKYDCCFMIGSLLSLRHITIHTKFGRILGAKFTQFLFN